MYTINFSSCALPFLLNRLLEWNPTWKPKFFNIDKSQAEINAINSVFPDARILLCDFHRSQSQQRWLKSSDVPTEFRADLFDKYVFVRVCCTCLHPFVVYMVALCVPVYSSQT